MQSLMPFNYKILDNDTRFIVQQRTNEIKTLDPNNTRNMAVIGVKLCEVKARLEVGSFGRWLKTEFNWSYETANNFMNIAQRFPDLPNPAEFAPLALCLLA